MLVKTVYLMTHELVQDVIRQASESLPILPIFLQIKRACVLLLESLFPGWKNSRANQSFAGMSSSCLRVQKLAPRVNGIDAAVPIVVSQFTDITALSVAYFFDLQDK